MCNFGVIIHNLYFYMKVHETLWTEIQQRGPRAVHQVALRASDDPQAGDQHDARPRSPSY